MPNLLIWASGYPRPFINDAAEISSQNAKTWSPSSTDFRATAQRSGGGPGAASFDELLKHIERSKIGSIDKLGILAHSNSQMIGLAGRIITTGPDAPDVLFNPAGLINADILKAKQPQIDKLKNRFADHASIVLYSCNSGADLSLLIAFETAFEVDIYGFKEHVQTCTTFSGATITVRGRVVYSPIISDLVDIGLVNPCTFAKNTVWDLSPDMGFFARN